MEYSTTVETVRETASWEECLPFRLALLVGAQMNLGGQDYRPANGNFGQKERDFSLICRKNPCLNEYQNEYQTALERFNKNGSHKKQTNRARLGRSLGPRLGRWP